MRGSTATRSRTRIALGGLIAAAATLLVSAPPSSAAPKLEAASYPDMSTFKCRSDPLPISPGQNLNLVRFVNTCPNAEKVSGPAPANLFTTATEGYITRFKPSMVELKPNGREPTPSVWDLHLHHVVWVDLREGGGPTYASGEEKTHVKLPQGYGGLLPANTNWALNYMIHSLNASANREVAITWEIDWVPETEPDIEPTHVQWLDVAGSQVYPVFDAEKGYDTDKDGDFVFPDDADDPGEPAYPEETGKISSKAQWTPEEDVTLVFGAGHLHPGGLHVDLEVTRNGVTRKLFRSDAKYYEPAGAVSWDVSMEATRPDWRIALKAGDTVSIDTTYDVEKASWYESMGILPISYTTADDPAAKDPFDNRRAVRKLYKAGGILTHGRLPENIDTHARDDLGLPDPRDLAAASPVPDTGIEIDGFGYDPGGYAASKFVPDDRLRPPTIGVGESATFTNFDAPPGMPQVSQAWHSITSCKPPCNKDSGIGYPLANGPVKFDSGQLGYSSDTPGTPCGAGAGILCLNGNVVTDSHVYETPEFEEPGTYTYFCRIHPYMRGSIRVQD